MLSKIINSISFISVLLIFTLQLNAQKSISGVVTEEIITKDGKFLLHRTAHLPKGKVISGTVVVNPESEKTNKRQKQAENLKHYILKIEDQIIGSDGIFTIKLPDVDNIPLQIFTSEGKLIQEISFELSEPFIPENLKMPKTIRKDFAEKITGDFSGDISNANILLNEKPMDILAGNDTELFFKVEDIEPGKQDLSLEYDDIKATELVNVVDYTLQAGRLNLNRGESTYLDVKVVGLEDLQEPLELKVQNQSVGTVRLEGGDIQTIQITPSEVAETGIWQKRFDIQSLTRGSFNIYTELEKPEENQDQLNSTNDFPEEAPVKAEIPAPDALNPSGPDPPHNPPPAKSIIEIGSPNKTNPAGVYANEFPQSAMMKKGEPQTKSGDRENDCCDEFRSPTSRSLIFYLGDAQYVEINGNKLKFSVNNNGIWVDEEIDLDLDLEEAFCNLCDNQVLSRLTQQIISTHTIDEDGETVEIEGVEIEDVILGSPTGQQGSRDAYVLRVMNQTVNGKEISVSVTMNKTTCEVGVQVVVDGEFFENKYIPN